MKKIEKAFTLAETMIVIVVLGIIATLTIPALVNKNKESVAKTKVRKAMAAYESALNKMIIENDLKSDTALNTWAGANCANSTNYFKKVQGDGCIFKTSDGIWWNISNIERPIIAFKQDDLAQEKANAANDKTAFVLVGRFGTDGSLRVDDLGYETGHDYEGSLAQVQKLYNFLSGKKSSGTEAVNCDEDDIICKYQRGDSLPTCTDEKKSCIIYEYDEVSNEYFSMSNVYAIYDKDGNFVGGYTVANDSSNNEYKQSENIVTSNGTHIASTWIEENGIVYKNYEETYPLDGANIFTSWKLDSNNNVYKYSYYYISGDSDTVRESYWDEAPNGEVFLKEETVCTNKQSECTYKAYWYDSDNNKIFQSEESVSNPDGSECTTYYDSSGAITYQSEDCL